MEATSERAPGQRGNVGKGNALKTVQTSLSIATASYLVLLILLSVFGRDWYAFKFLQGTWFISYFVLIYLLVSSSFLDRLDRLEPWKAMLLIAFISFILQLPFLLGPASMSQDILRMERRGELSLDGNFPYRDFSVNKPPLYIWMVHLLSLPFGPEGRVFRSFFVLANAMVPVVMYAIHRGSRVSPGTEERGPLRISVPSLTWGAAAFAYALCPLTILETALAGHYDPVVVLTSLIAYLCLLKDRPYLTGFFLGLGFALKLYPMFIAPLFFLAFKGWRNRASLFIGFFTVPIVATLPVVFVDPALVLLYLRYQFVNWYTSYSLRYALEWLFGAVSVPSKAAYYLFTLALGGGTIYYILRGMFGRPGRPDATPLVLSMFILVSMGMGLSSIFLSAGAGNAADWTMGVIGTLMTITIVVLGLSIHFEGTERLRPLIKGFKLRALFTSTIKKDDVPFLVSCILLLVILTSAQFHPWYLSWVLPFTLASGVPRWSWTALLFFASLQSNSYPPWEL